MSGDMTYEEKMSKCRNFVEQVASDCDGSWILVESCNNDASCYLIPEGSESELSYYGKPANSLRFSDHWNWYSSTKKCRDEKYVQCRSLDMPWARRREEAGKATKPRFGIQVAYYDRRDRCYHHVYGDKFDRKTKTWTWVDAEPGAVARMMMTNKQAE